MPLISNCFTRKSPPDGSAASGWPKPASLSASIDGGGAWQLSGRKVLASGAGHIRRPLIAAESELGSIKNEIVGQPNDYMRSPLFRGAWRVIATQLGGLEAILELYKDQLAGSRNHRDPLQLARFGDALIAGETARLWVEKPVA